MSVDIYYFAALGGTAAGVVTVAQWVGNRGKGVIHDAVREAISPLNTRLTVIETKMDVFWRSVAVDAAKILHHPEPERAHIDALLDAFLDARMTQAEAEELRGYLQTIRDWEQGRPSDFPIYPGEQVAATILLHTMDHVIAPLKEKK